MLLDTVVTPDQAYPSAKLLGLKLLGLLFLAERVGAVKLVGNMSGGEMDMEDFVKEVGAKLNSDPKSLYLVPREKIMERLKCSHDLEAQNQS
ncbi:hypothetical protein IFR04_016297 [Cadophora malorum]|uniref:Uncharacterized protein n=1 Tax=Cadophora malorum TaxID=108018 RepID=A0A8H7T038_9HELO|nr:hypothetical protein IFR04_016297 [Cadophora malorum]